jgi:hypothetical protein
MMVLSAAASPFFFDRLKLPCLGAKNENPHCACCACSDSTIGVRGSYLQREIEAVRWAARNELMAKLGFPTRQDQIAGKKVCVRSKSGASDRTTYSCTIRATLGRFIEAGTNVQVSKVLDEARRSLMSEVTNAAGDGVQDKTDQFKRIYLRHEERYQALCAELGGQELQAVRAAGPFRPH